MSKNKKEDLIIDAVSGIDEDIVEKNLKKRFELWCKKGAKRFSMIKIAAIAACVALLATFIVVILPLIPTGQIPVYQGMTVSNEAPVINTESADARPFTNNKTISLLGKHNGKDDQKNRRPVVDIIKDSLTVDAESEYLYYSKPNEDIYITVHVNNPGEFEILSFTLNGVKYSSYMFEEGSDLENLVLKINVGDAEGVVEYTIDAIKYVEGTKIKDVLMEGDKTVSVAITPDAPVAEVTDVNIGISDISFSTSLNDENDLVNASGEDYFAVICNNDTIVDKQIISSKDKTPISFTGLDPDTTYRYAIIGVYDAIDGEGKCIHVLLEEEFTTQALVSIGDSYLDGADVCFDITWHESHTGNKTLDALALYDGENKIADLDVTADRIADLPFDKEFTLVATYTYNGTQYETYKTVYSPKTSEGLEMSYGSVVGVGSCNDTVLYINAPIAEGAFSGNSHIKEVYLGSGVETVGRYAFDSCSNLTAVGISNGVKLEQYAFNACASLKSVTVYGELGESDWMAFSLCPNLDMNSLGVGSGGFVTHTNNGEINISITNTNEGPCFTAVSTENTTPLLKLVASKVMDLKKGVYMEIRVDEFNYSSNIDAWFDVTFWDQMYMIPGMTEYGEGAQCLIRPNFNTIIWYKEGFTQVGYSLEEFSPKVVDGKHYLTVELSWDEANKTFVYTINGVSAPQDLITYMNEKWGGSDSYAYVGFCFFHNQPNEKIGCTILKYGTSAETATVPGQ